ncbi:MAG: Gldg family protein, partial [Bacteroidetes bacterium]|nr:Gldg family protein [Bacteroidota bacterium]
MNKLFSSKYGWVFAILLILLINFLASLFHFRIDLTQEKRYTLSEPTKKLLKQLDDNVNIDIFLKGDLKAGLKKLANSTDELLQEFKEYGNGKIHFHFYDPLANADDSAKKTILDSLQRMGIQQMTQVAQSKKGEEQSARFVLPGAIVKYKDKIFPVNLLKGASNA